MQAGGEKPWGGVGGGVSAERTALCADAAERGR